MSSGFHNITIYNYYSNYKGGDGTVEGQAKGGQGTSIDSHFIIAGLMKDFGKALLSASGKYEKLAKSAKLESLIKNQIPSLESMVHHLEEGDFPKYIEEMKQCTSTFAQWRGDPELALRMGRKEKNENNLTKAVVAFHAVSKLNLELHQVPKDNIRKIQFCVGQMTECCKEVKIHKQRLCILDIMRDVVEDLRNMERAEGNERMHNIAWCYKCLGSALDDMNDYKLAAKEMEKGINLLKETFGEEEAKKKRIFGLLLSSIGSAHYGSKDYEVALIHFTRAKDALDKSEDWEEAEKQESKESNALSVQRTQAKMEAGDVDEEILGKIRTKATEAEEHFATDDMTSYDRVFNETVELITDPSNEVSGIKLWRMGKDYFKVGSHVKAIFLFRLVSKAFLQEQNMSKYKFAKMQHCAGKLSEMFQKCQSQEAFNGKDGMFASAIEEIIQDLYKMKTDEEFCRLENIAWCYKCKSTISFISKKYKAAIEVLEEGINVMELPEMRGKSKKCRIYGLLKGSIGNCYSELEDHRKGEESYNEAVFLLQSSKDWGSAQEKKKCIKANEHNAQASHLKSGKHDLPDSDDEAVDGVEIL